MSFVETAVAIGLFLFGANVGSQISGFAPRNFPAADSFGGFAIVNSSSAVVYVLYGTKSAYQPLIPGTKPAYQGDCVPRWTLIPGTKFAYQGDGYQGVR